MFPWKESVLAGVAAAILGAPTLVRSKPAEAPQRIQPERPAETRRVPTQHLPVERPQPGPVDTTPRDEQARHLFRIAERCRGVGDFDKARVCYEEAHLISPSSRCGQLAIARLRQLERGWLRKETDNAEEQDLAAPRRLFRDADEVRPSLRSGNGPARRDDERLDGEELRRRDMLRSTQPLDTLPKGKQSSKVEKARGEWQAVQYYEVSPVQLSGPSREELSKCLDRGPEWFAESTWKNIRRYTDWLELYNHRDDREATRSKKLSDQPQMPPAFTVIELPATSEAEKASKLKRQWTESIVFPMNVRALLDWEGTATGLEPPEFVGPGQDRSRPTTSTLFVDYFSRKCLEEDFHSQFWHRFDSIRFGDSLALARQDVRKDGQFVLLRTNSQLTAACESCESQEPCVIVERELLESWRRDCNFLFPVDAYQGIVVHHLHPDGSLDANGPRTLLGSVSMTLVVLPSHRQWVSLEDASLTPTNVNENDSELLRLQLPHSPAISDTVRRAERTKLIAAAMEAAAESLPEVQQEMMPWTHFDCIQFEKPRFLAESVRTTCARLKLTEAIHYELANSEFLEIDSLMPCSSLNWSNSNGTIRVYDNSAALRSQLSSLSVILVVRPSSVLYFPPPQKQRDPDSYDIADTWGW